MKQTHIVCFMFASPLLPFCSSKREANTQANRSPVPLKSKNKVKRSTETLLLQRRATRTHARPTTAGRRDAAAAALQLKGTR